MAGFDHVVLDITAYSVLRPKQGAKIDLLMFMKKISRMSEPMIYRCLVTNEPNSLVADQLEPGFK